MARIFIPCSEAARRVSQAQDTRLTGTNRIGLWLHLAVCRFCRRYFRHVRFLRRTLRRFPDHLDEVVPEELSPEGRGRIIRTLNTLE